MLDPLEIVNTLATLSDAAAANFSIAYLSPQLCLEKVGFRAGQRVLELGVGGAVGNATIQLAQALGAVQVISTAAQRPKRSWPGKQATRTSLIYRRKASRPG